MTQIQAGRMIIGLPGAGDEHRPEMLNNEPTRKHLRELALSSSWKRDGLESNRCREDFQALQDDSAHEDEMFESPDPSTGIMRGLLSDRSRVLRPVKLNIRRQMTLPSQVRRKHPRIE